MCAYLLSLQLVVLAVDANTDEERTTAALQTGRIFGDMHLGWRDEPITADPCGAATNGLRRATGFVCRTRC